MRSQEQGLEEVELQAKQVRVTRLPLGETGEGTGNRINSLAVELMEENTCGGITETITIDKEDKVEKERLQIQVAEESAIPTVEIHSHTMTTRIRR